MYASGELGLDRRGEASDPVLVLSGELEIETAPPLQDAVTRLCADGARTLTLDLSGLTFVDSIGLAAIVYASRQCERHECELELIPGIASVQRVFEITGLATLLPFRAVVTPTTVDGA
jgi:anti-sigma B factor antagonist